MALPGYEIDERLGDAPCRTQRDSWVCRWLRPRKGDLDMEGEHYECTRPDCRWHEILYYDEMR